MVTNLYDEEKSHYYVRNPQHVSYLFIYHQDTSKLIAVIIRQIDVSSRDISLADLTEMSIVMIFIFHTTRNAFLRGIASMKTRERKYGTNF